MNSDDPFLRRWWTVMVAGVAAATLVGFVSATRRAPAPAGYAPPKLAATSGIQPAPTNARLASGRESPNRLRQAENLARLSAASDSLRSGPHDAAAWQAALQRRSERRAYDGAPPVIPHPIDQRALPNCSTCHEQQLRIGDKLAPPPSHESKASCTQCHVVASSPVPLMAGLPDQPPLANTFSGLAAPGPGARAWPGAPPVIPHATLMRERCASCHGALSALHSSHVERKSCTQCHGPSALLDQRAPLARRPQPGAAPR